MRTLVTITVAILVNLLAGASPVFGHGFPIIVNVVDGQLKVSGGTADPLGFAPMIFLDGEEDGQLDHVTLPNLGDVGLTNLPGLDISGVTANSGIFLNVLARPDFETLPIESRLLWYWNEIVTVAPNEESLNIASEFELINLPQSAGPVPAALRIAEPLPEDLGQHVHFLRYLLDDSPPAATGAYGFFARLTSPKYDASDPLLVMFNNGIGADQLSAAAIAINAAAHLPGDFDRDDQLTVHDVDLLADEVHSLTPNLRFDVNGSGLVEATDIHYWVKSLKGTWIGDANLDGEFGSSDLVTVFQGGRYETTDAAEWSTGDWDGDRRFVSTDVVAAFQDGGYERGPRAAAINVPEPVDLAFFLFGLVITRIRRRSNDARSG